MRPNKVNGLTQAERMRRCTGKRRWSDELSACAGALDAVERHREERLWVYQCPHCRGWHLTRSPQRGKEPAAQRAQPKMI